jgi:hypothetical protein
VSNSNYIERYEYERSLPPLEEVLEQLEAGLLEYFLGPENRDGKRYRIVQLRGPDGETLTGLHRIIAASALGHWVDRRAEVDHINHDPSDNRAENLEIVTPSVNRERRRQRLDASKAANPDKVRKRVNRRKAKFENQQAKTQAAIDIYLSTKNRQFEVSNRSFDPQRKKRVETAFNPRSTSTSASRVVPVPRPRSKTVSREALPSGNDLEAKLRTVTSLEELNGILNRRDIAPHLPEWTEDEIELIESRRRFLEKKRYRPY